ncbi:MAG: methylenetetrahydrofolate reductase [Clostridia bacterium]|nr:methylenetetrahydrofolate reductase [NAD(P)H] [Clostridia bacterium]
MKIKDLFIKDKPLFSLEIFPPKKTSPIETIYSTLDELVKVRPAFISVTYGAGGNGTDNRTAEIASIVKNKYGVESVAHLSCLYNSCSDVDETLRRLRDCGVDNILALRGDVVPDVPILNDFRYASDLVRYIAKSDIGDFDLCGACYPEGHVEAENLEKDVENLKIKVDAGATHLISQLFFDNDYYYDFLDMAAKKGVNVPIEAGIMPVINKKQIERMVTLCGASLPPKFAKMMQKYGDNPEAIVESGIAYAVDQIVDLLSYNVDGIHLYAMNNPYVVNKIYSAIEKLL